MRNIFDTVQEKRLFPTPKRETPRVDARNLEVSIRQIDPEKQESSASDKLNNSSNPAPVLNNGEERRRLRRASVKMPVRIRPADIEDRKFEEVLATTNACRFNLYVITENKCYYQRMRLRITFPFLSAHDSVSTSEDNAEIVRLDPLPDGRTGIAISLQRSNHATAFPAPTRPNLSVKRASERRFTVRHPVSATAKVTDMDSATQLEARCSDLSIAGCYIDTLNPFPENSSVCVKLSDGIRTVEVLARVITNHIGMGMGLVFDEMAVDQALMLVNWLGNTGDSPLPIMGSVNTELTGSSNKERIVKLLHLLQSNGKLTHAQISTIILDAPAI